LAEIEKLTEEATKHLIDMLNLPLCASAEVRENTLGAWVLHADLYLV